MITLFMAACAGRNLVGDPWLLAEVQARTFALTMESEGASEPLHASVTMQYVRAFSDGSAGWLVCLEGALATAPLACVELRAFPGGEIVTLRGVDRFTGEGGGIEWLDTLWPILSALHPAYPEVVGWPLARIGANPTRVVASTTASSRHATRWQATLSWPAGTRWKSGQLGVDLSAPPADNFSTAKWHTERTECGKNDPPCTGWSWSGALVEGAASAPRKVEACAHSAATDNRAALCLDDGTVVDSDRSVPVAALFATPPAWTRSFVESAP